MFFYFIIMLHHKHLSLGSVFLRQRRLLSCHFHHIIQIMHFFHFPKFKTLTSHLFKFRQTLAQPTVSAPEGYRNQRTLTQFKIGFRHWIYVFRSAYNTWKRCYVHLTIRVECCWGTVQCIFKFELFVIYNLFINICFITF